MIERVIVAGGGTGGHLYPGIAVIDELRRRNPELRVLYVGTQRGIESRVIPSMGERLETLDVSPLQGVSWVHRARSLAKLPGAWGQALRIVVREKPDLVLGVGGYAAGPVVAAARAAGVPTAVLEQNAHVGLTNRLVAPWVGRAYVSFAETTKLFGDRARLLGNPVRRVFVEAAMLSKADPAFERAPRRVLVVGGSQGARTLNRTVPLALARLALSDVEIVHQTGPAMHADVVAEYARLGVTARVVPFLDDMAHELRRATVVVCRAGASTLAELAAMGRPSVLVPYPFAADDHQMRNARAFERAGAAKVFADRELEAGPLAETLASILGDARQRGTMAAAARDLGHPEAASAIVDDLLGWLAPNDEPSGDDGSDLEDDPSGLPSVGSGTREGRAETSAPQGAWASVDFRVGRAIRFLPRELPALHVEPFVPPKRATPQSC